MPFLCFYLMVDVDEKIGEFQFFMTICLQRIALKRTF